MAPKKAVPDLIREGCRFPAFAKPASAGEGRSDKIMLRRKSMIPKSGYRFSDQIMLESKN
jgi:hypothetical protein